MKIEVERAGKCVEIRLLKDDGTIDVWVCENDQAAIFKVAALFAHTAEPEEHAKRSIFLGTFEKDDDAKKRARKERKELEKAQKDLLEKLLKEGYAQKEVGGQPFIAPVPYPTPDSNPSPYTYPYTAPIPYTIPGGLGTSGGTWIQVSGTGSYGVSTAGYCTTTNVSLGEPTYTITTSNHTIPDENEK